ncbi:hypothetical protein ACNHYB_11170 [Isoptericola jiangsuensis]
MLVPMSVTDPRYFQEAVGRLRAIGHDVPSNGSRRRSSRSTSTPTT